MDFGRIIIFEEFIINYFRISFLSSLDSLSMKYPITVRIPTITANVVIWENVGSVIVFMRSPAMKNSNPRAIFEVKSNRISA